MHAPTRLGITVIMSNDPLALLEEAYARYDAATVRVAAAGAGPDDVRAVREARVALCHALERSGWELPDEVRAQLLHDRTQLARGEDPVAA